MTMILHSCQVKVPFVILAVVLIAVPFSNNRAVEQAANGGTDNGIETLAGVGCPVTGCVQKLEYRWKDGLSFVDTSILFTYNCSDVIAWGLPARIERTFSASVTVNLDLPAVCLETIVTRQHTYELGVLPPRLGYSFTLNTCPVPLRVSRDPAKLACSVGMVIGFMVPDPDDTSPPTWPAGSSLTAYDVKTTGLTLEWTSAYDDSGYVIEYRIYRDEVLIGSEGVRYCGSFKHCQTFLVEGLAPGTIYTFKVEARDGSYNWSVGGPTTTVTTLE